MTTNDQPVSEIKRASLRWPVYVIPNAFVIVLWLLSWYLLSTTDVFKDWQERGPFGETFGAVNALFSGFAFAWIIITVYLQSQELALQRQELEYTRTELRGQKEQLQQQNKTLKVQKFETTFFQLLQLHHEIVNAIERYVGNHPVRGRRNFDSFYREFIGSYDAEYKKDPHSDPLIIIERSYLAFFTQKEPDLGHYFRNLYNIVKYVDTSDIENKKFYTNLIRAQLSVPELMLLFYDGLSSLGKDKFKPLIERYALLKNIPKGKLANSVLKHESDHVQYYEKNAFGT